MRKGDRSRCTREFLALAAAHGVVDVEPVGKDTVYVFVRGGLTPAQTKQIREMTLEWWNVPRVLVAARSAAAARSASLLTPDERKYRTLK